MQAPEEPACLSRLVGNDRRVVYSPQIHEEIARQRQADMGREAHRGRLAALAAANGPGKLARLAGVLARQSGSLAEVAGTPLTPPKSSSRPSLI